MVAEGWPRATWLRRLLFGRSGGFGGRITDLYGRVGLEGTGFVGPERAVVNREFSFDSVEGKAGMNALMRVSESWNGEERVASMQRAEE